MDVEVKRQKPIVSARSREVVRKTVLTLVLLIVTFVVLIPFIWMIVMSLRTTGAILENPYGFPEEFRWQNYARLILDPDIHFYTYIFNSVLVSFGAMAITLTLSSLGGYGFGRPRYRFKYRNVVLLTLLAALMLPRQAMYIPQFIMMSQYRLTNTLWSLVLLYAAYQLPLSTFLLKTYFSQLPGELEESARIDGAKDLLIFWKIMLPLARPVIATITIVNFRFFWNELLIALTMVTRPEIRTLPLAMMNFVGANSANYAMAAASLVVGMAPLVVLYLFLADRVVQGLTAGAVKG